MSVLEGDGSEVGGATGLGCQQEQLSAAPHPCARARIWDPVPRSVFCAWSREFGDRPPPPAPRPRAGTKGWGGGPRGEWGRHGVGSHGMT